MYLWYLPTCLLPVSSYLSVAEVCRVQFHTRVCPRRAAAAPRARRRRSASASARVLSLDATDKDATAIASSTAAVASSTAAVATAPPPASAVGAPTRRLAALPDGFGALAVEELNLSHNALTELPDAIATPRLGMLPAPRTLGVG